MTALTPGAVGRERRRPAIERASKIRTGIVNYLQTLGVIAEAYREQDHLTLGYDTWQAYIDAEFGAERLRLTPEHRRKAVEELRLSGLSTRAIGAAVGVSHPTVIADMKASGGQDLPPEVTGIDGKTYAAKSPLVEALTEAIEEAGEAAAPPPSTPPRPAQHVTADTWSPDERRLQADLEAGDTVVVTLRGSHDRLIRWAEREGLYARVDRKTPWGNPFEMPADGDRDTVIAHYAAYYLPHKPSLLAKLDTLRGKALGCWCAPEPCHADVLKEAAS